MIIDLTPLKEETVTGRIYRIATEGMRAFSARNMEKVQEKRKETLLLMESHNKEFWLLQVDFPEEGGGIEIQSYDDGSLHVRALGRDQFPKAVEKMRAHQNDPSSNVRCRLFDPKNLFGEAAKDG